MVVIGWLQLDGQKYIYTRFHVSVSKALALLFFSLSNCLAPLETVMLIKEICKDVLMKCGSEASGKEHHMWWSLLLLQADCPLGASLLCKFPFYRELLIK